jgi:hypothetical protein
MIKGTCRKHGPLDEITGFRYASKTTPSGFRLKCKKCFDERINNYLEENKNCELPDEIKGFCRKHGSLNNDSGFICLDKSLPSGYRIRCKECTHRLQITRYVNNRQEKIDKAQVWKKENRGRINEQVREDRRNNPEKYKKWHSDYYAKNRDKLSFQESLRARNLKKDFYDKMMEEQENKCKICKQPETRMARDGKTITRLCIDHDHDTNEVRALLCHDCNTMLGKAKDSPELLIEAAYYLVDHKGWTT